MLWAVHISDGVLSPTWLTGGFVLAALLVLLGSWRIRDEEIPQIALLSAAFFVASLFHVRVWPTSVHLLLNGLLGVLLGWRACLAIPVGLFLQAVLIQHGGYYTLGINSCVLVLPALLSSWLFTLLKRVPWVREPWLRAGFVGMTSLAWTLSLVLSLALLTGLAPVDISPWIWLGALVVAGVAAVAERRLENAPEFPLGLLVGEVAVLTTLCLNAGALYWGGLGRPEDWQTLALLTFVAHLPIAVVEGVILGFAIGFLARVKPAMLGWTVAEDAECSVDSLV